MYRPLTTADLFEIADVFASRSNLRLLGVNWSPVSIENELNVSSGWGMFEDKLQAFIIYKDLGSVFDILLIFSRFGTQQAGQSVLKSLIDAHGQLRELWLEVHEDNQRAVRFYESQGFQQVGRRPGYYPHKKAALNYRLLIR